ncbi:hypothetical protein DH2020_028631 [Rehmannia glutinosa]|uniref:Uncharacterized protein n=1 Tax=Rehmannia glutinosa TaxID=99300 RepID=A0ABR0VUY4_REHGL
MAIPAWLFFSFWAIISLTFLKLGFNALDRTDLSTSVPSAVLFLFKHSLAISIIHSSNYALIYRRLSPIPFYKYCSMVMLAVFVLLFYRTAGEPFAWNSLFYYLIHFIILLCNPILKDFFQKFYMFVIIAFLIPLLYSTGNESFAAISGNVENLETTIVGKRKKVRFIEFGVGMAGAILFQKFFRLTLLDHVVAFLYFAVAWLANLALLRASFDFGVFDFLLSNVIVGCTVGRFGFGGAAWLAYGASLVLYGLRLKLECVSLVRRGGAHVIGF